MRKWMEGLLSRLDLTARFQLTTSIILLVALVAIGAWIARMIDEGVIRVTSSTTAMYMESVVGPQLAGLEPGDSLAPDRIDALDRLLGDTVLGKNILAFKIWGPGGKVLYDTDRTSIGQVFPMVPRLARSWQGETMARISDLEDEENASERRVSNRLLEIYSPVHEGGSGRILAVAEFYESVDALNAEVRRAQVGSWLVMAAVMLLIYILLVRFVGRAGHTIARQQGELSAQVLRLQELLVQNEELHGRVRRGAAQIATINERFLRRISAELHDGPVQELSLALLRVDPVREPSDSVDGEAAVWSTRDALLIQTSLRHALEEVRAISAGLGLPELYQLALPEVVNRAVQTHERRTGTAVSLQIEEVPEQAPLPVKIALYRVIQEGLTNAFRHAGGAGQRVNVRSDEDYVRVEVHDSGPGFDLTHLDDWESSRVHLGVVGMRERVLSLGGTFSIESLPGIGTTIRACFSLQEAEVS